MILNMHNVLEYVNNSKKKRVQSNVRINKLNSQANRLSSIIICNLNHGICIDDLDFQLNLFFDED